MTMISREAAIKIIESMTGDKSDVYSMAMADAADALRSLPAVKGWVSVTDGMPVCNKRSGSFGVPVLVYDGREVFAAYYGKRLSRTPQFYLHGAILDGVLKWQPLPAAPKGEA